MNEFELSDRVTKVEVKVDVLEKKVDNMDDMKTVIATLAAIQQEREKRDIIRDEQAKEQSQALIDLKGTLIRINDNLDALNNEANETKDEVKQTKDEVKQTNVRIDKLENKFYVSEDKSKIDLRDVIKNVFLKVLFPIGCVSAILYEILK